MRKLLVLILLLFLATAPAPAAEVFTLKASGAVTSAGNGSALDVGNWRNLTVVVNVTAGSGTVNPFRVWIESSVDGTTFFEVPCRLVLKTGAAAPGAGTANQRDIVNETTVQTSSKYWAVCEVYSPTVRAAWNIAGTTPSETFSVLASAK